MSYAGQNDNTAGRAIVLHTANSGATWVQSQHPWWSIEPGAISGHKVGGNLTYWDFWLRARDGKMVGTCLAFDQSRLCPQHPRRSPEYFWAIHEYRVTNEHCWIWPPNKNQINNKSNHFLCKVSFFYLSDFLNLMWNRDLIE